MSGILLMILAVVVLAPAALVALVVYAIRFQRPRARIAARRAGAIEAEVIETLPSKKG